MVPPPSTTSDSDGHTTGVRVTKSLGLVADDVGTANRIVGFYEYRKALSNFDKFLEEASHAEIAAADELIRERDEFAVFVNLSRLLPRNHRSKLAEVTRPDDDFQRRGFRWLTAVARIEVQSIMAAFSSHREPFSVLPSTEFDETEYNEVLLDAMRTHFWAFESDPNWKRELASKVPSSRTLAYLRRLAMLSGFVRTVVQRMGDDFDVEQAAEITTWQENIGNSAKSLHAKVQRAINASQLSNEMDSVQIRSLLKECQGVCASFR